MHSYMSDTLMCKVARAAIRVSFERRVAFLDRRVIDLSDWLPPAMNIRDGKRKWPLRQLLYRQVPRNLTKNPTISFGTSIRNLLLGHLRGGADDLLAGDVIRSNGLLTPVRVIGNEHLSRRQDRSNHLCIVLMFMIWWGTKR